MIGPGEGGAVRPPTPGEVDSLRLLEEILHQSAVIMVMIQVNYDTCLSLVESQPPRDACRFENRVTHSSAASTMRNRNCHRDHASQSDRRGRMLNNKHATAIDAAFAQ